MKSEDESEAFWRRVDHELAENDEVIATIMKEVEQNAISAQEGNERIHAYHEGKVRTEVTLEHASLLGQMAIEFED